MSIFTVVVGAECRILLSVVEFLSIWRVLEIQSH